VSNSASIAIRRLPLLAIGILVLLAGMWGGLLRLGWIWTPALVVSTISYHGPLMVGGFLGTLISLERAVALRKWWAYGAPVAAASGAVALILGLPVRFGQDLLLLASTLLVIEFIILSIRQPTAFIFTMGLGALAWWMGNLIWRSGQDIPPAVWWWIGFLVLTIVGERLELSRFLRDSPARQPTFILTVALYCTGLIAGLWFPGLGWALAGAGLIAMAIWLAIYDLARRTIRQRGLTRFVAICLFSGYLWLAIGGVLAICYTTAGPSGILPANWMTTAPTYGLAYDAILHATLLGFVFAMIFGHAPIIFPAVLSVRMEYRPRFYLHWALLEFSVLARIVSDIAGSASGRHWAGLFNVIAVLVFLANTISTIRLHKRQTPPAPAPRPGLLKLTTLSTSAARTPPKTDTVAPPAEPIYR
jgi:hypothetical protein